MNGAAAQVWSAAVFDDDLRANTDAGSSPAKSRRFGCHVEVQVHGQKEAADLPPVTQRWGNKSPGVSIVSHMAGVFFIDGIRRWLRRRNREKKLGLAAQWPTVQAEINHWQVLNADEDVATMGAPYQIEAGFHFMLKDEY